MENVQNVFTSEYKSRLSRVLHNTQECSVVQGIDLNQNDWNEDIINFIQKKIPYCMAYRVCYNSSP